MSMSTIYILLSAESEFIEITVNSKVT